MTNKSNITLNDEDIQQIMDQVISMDWDLILRHVEYTNCNSTNELNEIQCSSLSIRKLKSILEKQA